MRPSWIRALAIDTIGQFKYVQLDKDTLAFRADDDRIVREAVAEAFEVFSRGEAEREISKGALSAIDRVGDCRTQTKSR